MIEVREDDLSGRAVADLLAEHLEGMRAHSPPDRVHALDLDALRAPAHLRAGAGAAMLARIVTVARERGYRRLSLETGSGPAFEPAETLYRRFGFAPCGAFGDYPGGDPFTRFMSRELD